MSVNARTFAIENRKGRLWRNLPEDFAKILGNFGFTRIQLEDSRIITLEEFTEEYGTHRWSHLDCRSRDLIYLVDENDTVLGKIHP